MESVTSPSPSGVKYIKRVENKRGGFVLTKCPSQCCSASRPLTALFLLFNSSNPRASTLGCTNSAEASSSCFLSTLAALTMLAILSSCFCFLYSPPLAVLPSLHKALATSSLLLSLCSELCRRLWLCSLIYNKTLIHIVECSCRQLFNCIP